MLSQEHPIELSTELSKTELSKNAALIASTLNHALLACEQETWAETIAACEQVIALCNQNIANQNPAGQNSASQNSDESDKTAAAMYRSKAELYQQQGQISDAIAAFQKAVHYDAQSADTHTRIAALYAREQQWTEAHQHYQQALALMPARLEDQENTAHAQTHAQIRSALADVLFHLGEKLKHQGDVTGAVRACLQAVQQQPLFYQGYNRLRYNLMRYDIADNDALLDEIVSVCKQNISQHLELHSAHVALGYALTKLGRLDEAIACYRAASDFMTRRQLNAVNGAASGTTANSTAAKTDADVNPIISQQRLKPSFMVIGAEKCGTTSLYQYLARHPQVLASVEKEIDFFDMEYGRGLDWYLSHFPAQPTAFNHPASNHAAQNHWISGETSANYLYSNVAPERVFEQFPQLQLVVLLRHPVDRTISRYNMMVRNGVEKRSFEVAIAEEIQLIEQAQVRVETLAQSGSASGSSSAESIPWSVLNRCRHIGNSLYYYHLQRWLQYFSADQLFVLRSEDLFLNPEQTLTMLCQKLEISPPPEQTYRKYNAGEYDVIPQAVRQRLFEFYQPHIRQLETLLDRSFNWASPSV